MFCITLVLNPEWTVKIKLMIQKSWRSRRHFIYVAAGFSALENFPSQSASFTHHWCIHYYITNKWNDLNTRFSKGSLRSFFDGGISILSLHLFRQFYKIGCAFSQNPVFHSTNLQKERGECCCSAKGNFSIQWEKIIAHGSWLMEAAEQQFCILSTVAFSCYANGSNSHPWLSYTFSGF